jgi:membrane protease subunit (stomatin/prohibitin family)
MAVHDLIQYPNEQSNEIVHRIPETGAGEFRLGSQLVVRESQQVVFARDGKALDVFGPGRHTLSTNNIPLLGGLIGSLFGGDSPFTAEAYFVSMRQFTDLKWGSAQPLVYRDTELGVIRLRAFGTYSIRVKDPQVLVNQLMGAAGNFSTTGIEDFLRSVILNQFNDLLGDVHTSILDLQKMTMEVANAARLSLADAFNRLGLELLTFNISAITPPDEVSKMIDQRSSMAAIGDMGAYTQFQAVQALRDAAQNPGGGGDATSTGVGLGAGLGLGQVMANAFQNSLNQPQQPQQVQQTPAPTATATTACPACKATIPANSKFCPECGTKLTQ